MNDYSTSTDAFNDLGTGEGNYTTSDYPIMVDFITAASRAVDLEVGRPAGFFYPTTDEVTKYYNGSGCEELSIGEWVSISAVGVSEQGGLASTDYTAFSSSDYFVEPYNYMEDGKPINKLVIDRLNGSQSSFGRYRKGVKVTGIYGYSLTPPATIARAVRRQAIKWFMAAKQGYQQEGASANIGGLTFSIDKLDSDIKEMIWPFILELS